MKSESSTYIRSFDTFHGVTDHKKKKDIHMEVSHEVKAILEKKKKEVFVPIMLEGQECIASTSNPCLKAEKKKVKVNYKSGGNHWIMDSGCSQHMTGNSRIFSTLEEGDHDRDHITLGDNSKKKVIGLGKIATPMTSPFKMCFMLKIFALIFYPLVNYVILAINVFSPLMIFWSLTFMTMS